MGSDILLDEGTPETYPGIMAAHYEAEDVDTRLMLAFQEGDPAAFDRLVERCRRRALNIAWHFLQDPEAAEDLAQEAFLRVYQARHTYRPTAQFSTWFTTIVTRLCLNERRRRKPDPVPSEDLEHLLDRRPSPEQAALRAELARQVDAALASLPEKQRLAVILHRYEGLSYQEIAQSMELSLSAVESLLHRAKQQLRKSLGSYVTGILR